MNQNIACTTDSAGRLGLCHANNTDVLYGVHDTSSVDNTADTNNGKDD